MNSLFDDLPLTPPTPLARATDPHTSHQAAAEHVASGENQRQRAACLAAMQGRQWMTSDEIAVAAGLERHAAARRLPELARDGLVERGPARVSRVGGRAGVTWRRVKL